MSKWPTQSRPSRFRPAGKILWAEPSDTGPAFTRGKPRHRGSRANGVRYENWVHCHLKELFNECYTPGPWVRFGGDYDQVRWCQPDGLLFDVLGGVITVIEIKYNHTPLAWWQLRQLYGPIVQFLFPSFHVQVCEVCKWYDCAVVFPEKVHPIRALEVCDRTAFNVHILTKSRSN